MKKVLIVGGVAVGASVAARLRRLDEEIEIVMFEKGPYISYANCGLPYNIGGVIKDREKLIVTKAELMRDRFKIDVRAESEVVAIHSKDKAIKIRSKERGEYVENYDYLVLSPGAKAIKPNIPGVDGPRIMSLRTIPDTDKINEFITKNTVKKATVIGGGFIGIETAENLIERGIDVTLVEAAPHILAPFDSDMVTIAEKELEEHGIKLRLNDGVKAFEDTNSGVEITLSSGKKLTSDLVILAIGVTPDTGFLKDSGIEITARGHIVTNTNMETNIEGIYAGGDAVEVVDFVNKTKTAIPLAGPANKQGRIIADNIAGIKSNYKDTQGTSVLKIFDLIAASTGNNERTLNRLDIKYNVIYIHPNSHAGYYPGATPFTIKAIFDDQGKLLGAQAIGYKGVEKRIDVIATTMRLGGTIYDLTELELSYAPPFNSAKDPVNMVGYVAENILTGKTEVVLPRDVDSRDKDKVVVLDVRTKIERENGSIDDSIHIDVNELRYKLDTLDKNKEYWVHCAVGIRAYIAERILKQHGFKAKNITGGYKSYIAQKFVPKDLDDYTSGSDNYNKEQIMQSQEATREAAVDSKEVKLDACGLCCPGPLITVKETMDTLNPSDVLNITASDPGFYEDIKAWCKRTNNTLLNIENKNGIITAKIEKNINNVEKTEMQNADITNAQTMVVFSGDLDKAIASFIIANGAAAMGKKVTMFFTFWGLNVLRKHDRIKTKKNPIEKAFGFMMPRGSKKLKLSKMNMAGMGGKLIRGIMRSKEILSLEDLIEQAQKSGVNLVACTMSMDVMGIKEEELVSGVNYGGVGYYLGEATDSNINLFI
ncbi:DsrE/DsrF/DrsH-like family protein [Clostridium cellulovorans]|uniref:FAD-dependent pyridine nucleotide-disulphide oxidoreductase n=1 Tax=Clostridium cellulovorans (strain ATCC 35296 / DSM 3052 / OCM 3 / 743B) TaxID=573061 RepID=D9SRT1_CLOC7|nr:DsrE/DsrF/DrsH-like family protein [Clostridium cellulovorans]ADL50448.1 FAD-dependent pyridine nucleotide-disulphide oxidoreductase [Clostridium cellulovorans 743B]